MLGSMQLMRIAAASMKKLVQNVVRIFKNDTVSESNVFESWNDSARRNDLDTSQFIKVFAHLAIDKDVDVWREHWRSGALVGINDETPYGYGRASRMGCTIRFSKTSIERLPSKVLRLGVRFFTGFDGVYAFRQRRHILAADVVWTHTESQYLAVAAVVSWAKKRPKILGQSVWLFDRWDNLHFFQKFLYKRLMRYVDVLTVHSPINLAVAKKIFPNKVILIVPFGIPSEHMTHPIDRHSRPLRILSVGNDRHRDWRCLVDAVDGLPGATATILSGTAPRSLLNGRPHLRMTKARSTPELFSEFAKASVACVPLKPNMHASGITAIQEAVLAGVPVIATATGGLDSYFPADSVRYVPPSNPDALREALQEIARDPSAARAQAIRAQQHMVQSGLGSESYIQRHVDISRAMLGR